MSGHSKWAGIKHKKAITDAKRGQLFTKVAREIEIAAREGGGNPENNFRLRLAIQKAKDVNMPAENIERAIKRGTGEIESTRLETLRYEGYGPSGVAIMVDVVTDNRNRTSSTLRHVFAKHGGSLGEVGSVAWMFQRKGLVTASLGGKDPDEVSLAAIEAGAEDIQIEGQQIEVQTDPKDLEQVRAALEAAGVKIENAQVTMLPTTTVEVSEENIVQVLKLLDALEDLDDVQEVYSNFEVPQEVLERVSEKV
jgi:YebC/PmpR family DNA-binding regulatory protein